VTWPALAWLDRIQRTRTWLAFPVAVVKKFGDDRAGSLAALITYYGFASLFPLLLVLVTAAEVVLHDRPEFRDRLIDSALAQFPVVGDRLASSVPPIQGSAWVILLGTLIAVWSGLAGVGAAQRAMDDVWDVPRRDRPGFVPAHARALGMLVVLGTFVVAVSVSTAVLGSLGTGIAVVAGGLLAAALNTLVAAAAFRVLSSVRVGWPALLPGAVCVGIAWTVLQALGGWLVGRQVRGASELYGSFGLVLGLLAWIYLAAETFVLGAEVNVVKHRRLWPRRLFPPPLETGDRRAIADDVREQAPRPEVEVGVTFHDPPRGVDAGREG
jgi:YihY family inner membrane protein